MAASEAEDFEEFFRRMWPAAFGVARRVLGDSGDAEDAAAEAFARALVDWDRTGRLDHRDAWLLRVTSNVAIDRARRRVQPPAPGRTMVEDHQDAAVVRVALVEALGALPRRQREVIALRHLCGLSETEVAAALGISRNSVKKHTTRGISRLRQRLTDFAGEVDLAFRT